MSFLHDVHHPEVIDALLGFVYDPLDPANAALDDLLNTTFHHDADHAFLNNPLHADADRHCAKKQRACHGLLPDLGVAQHFNGGGNHQVPGLLNDFVLPLPLPLPSQQQQLLVEAPVASLARVADAKNSKQDVGNNVSQQSVQQSAAARQRRKRISEKTAELSRLIPGGHKLNTAEMLEAAARHVKLLQAQVGMLALMHNVFDSTEKDQEMAFMASQEQMQALLACSGVQEWLAAEERCLVPRKLVDAMAKDSGLKSNALVNRDLGRFVASLQGGQ